MSLKCRNALTRLSCHVIITSYKGPSLLGYLLINLSLTEVGQTQQPVMPRVQRLDDVSCAICMDSLFTKLNDLDEIYPTAAPDCGKSWASRSSSC